MPEPAVSCGGCSAKLAIRMPGEFGLADRTLHVSYSAVRLSMRVLKLRLWSVRSIECIVIRPCLTEEYPNVKLRDESNDT